MFVNSCQKAHTNCPEDSTTTFEKIVGYKPSHSRLAPMYGLSEDNNSGTTADCIQRLALQL